MKKEEEKLFQESLPARASAQSRLRESVGSSWWSFVGIRESQVRPYLNQPAAYSLIRYLTGCCSQFPSPGRLVALD